MENFVILAKLPLGWPTPTGGGDGSRTGTGPSTTRSPMKLVEEIVDTNGGRVDTILTAPINGKVQVLCIGELPNHEAALKIVFGLNQFGLETEYGVAIDSQVTSHAWEFAQKQTAESRGR